MRDLILFSGNSNISLAKKIAAQLGCKLEPARISQFNDSETQVEILVPVKGKVTCIIQSTSAPCNQHILEICFMADALRRAGAKEIIAVIPYFAYARQDRSALAHTSIGAKVVAQILERSGVNQIISLDLHSDRMQGFFNIPITNICATEIFLARFKQKNLNAPVIVAPDIGGLSRARMFAQQANISDLAIVLKDRKVNTNKIQVLGNVANRDAVIIDDIVDSGVTIANTAHVLKLHGARQIYAFCTHAVLSSQALNMISNSPLAELVMTDSIEISNKISSHNNISQMTAAVVIAKAIQQIMQYKYFIQGKYLTMFFTD